MPPQLDRAATLARTSLIIRRATLLGIAMVLGMVALGAYTLGAAREDVRHEAERSATNLTIVLERDIARNFGTYALSLQGTVDALRMPGLDAVSGELRRTALFDRAVTAEYLGSVLVLDAVGRVLESSNVSSPPLDSLVLTDRDYFQVHRDSPTVGIYVSQPFASRMRGGDPTIAVSRRLTAEDGSFAGVVVGALRLAYFDRLFELLDLGPGSVVSVVRTDGVMIARRPHVPNGFLNIGGAATFQHMMAQSPAQFIDPSPIDGVQRLYSTRRIGTLPLIVSVGLSLEDIYAAWWRKAAVIATVLFLLSVATAGLCLLFRREMLRRLAAEAELVALAERMRVAAATDPLTGLANRRAFEERLGEEWRRAMRWATEVSLLMIDADHFKAFNDRYGHPAGDAALARMAEVLRANAKRPGDVVARVGGEEFVALLPETGLDGALATAERIQTALREADVTHAGSPTGRMTFSIGVTVAHPQLAGQESQLVRRADMALYEAKAGGRDRIVVRDDDYGVGVPVNAVQGS